MRRVRTIAIGISSILLSFGLCILLLEIGLAIAQVNTKADSQFVPGIGAMHIPHAYYRNTKEGFSEGYFNSHGFRDYERSYAKPSDTFRILVLGDSFVEALQVPLENSFPALLEKKLNENHPLPKFEVLNLGQSGFGTADEYLRYLNFGVKYDPDIVILAFLTGNDFRNNSRFLNVEEVGPYYVFDKDENLVLDRTLIDQYEKSLTLPQRVFQFIKRKSYLVNFISERLYLLSFQSRHLAFEHLGSGGALGELEDTNIYSPVMSDRWKEALAITEALLSKFKNTIEENGQRFVLITLSNADQLDPEAQVHLKKAFGIPFDFEQPDRIIEKFATRERIPYLKLMPVFRDYHVRTGKTLHGFGGRESGHWNETGHWLAAKKIFEFLTEKNLLPTVSTRVAE